MNDLTPRGRAAALLAAVLALLSIVALGSGAEHRVVLATPAEGSAQFEPLQKEQEPSMEPDWGPSDQPEPEQLKQTTLSASIMTLLMVGGAVGLLLLIVWIVRRAAQLRTRTTPPAPEVDAEAQLSAQEAEEALTAARERLETGMDVRDAVVTSWQTLEAMIAETGVRRAESQTTREYVVTVLGGLALDTDTIGRFADLYRRALFDANPLTDADLDQGRELLEDLTTQIRELRQEATR